MSKDGLLIRLRLNGLNSLVAELQGDGPVELGKDGQTVAIRVPMEFKFHGGWKEIILPKRREAEPKARPNRPLVLALARVHWWQRMIDSGEVPGVEAMAASMKWIAPMSDECSNSRRWRRTSSKRSWQARSQMGLAWPGRGC